LYTPCVFGLCPFELLIKFELIRRRKKIELLQILFPSILANYPL
jgi:hypothetical protein